MIVDRKFSGPTTANLEITEKCNARCLHCYNPWREEHMGVNTFAIDKLKKTIDELKKAGVFHIILTGGEPMSKMDVLIEALTYGKKLGFSFSCNSNLMLTTDEKMKKLNSLGLDHVLTSFPSVDKIENDKIMQVKNSVKKIEKGITNCIKNGIRISVNMVITKFNYRDVFETGQFIFKLGCQKMFITRAVPPVSNTGVSDEYKLTHDEAKFALDEGIRLKKETGIMIGTLVNYPVCFLGDLEKYKDFFGRGCPSQRGHRVNINATGDLHTCVHEETDYGNILEDDLSEVYQTKMRTWHDKEKMIYEGCKGCDYISTCYSGCQMIALAFNGKFGTKDPLYVGPNSVSKKYMIDNDLFKKIEQKLDDGLIFKIKKDLRFREENGFDLVNIQWGNTISVTKDISNFIKKFEKNEFKLEKIPFNKPTIVFLILKNIIQSNQLNFDNEFKLQGLSINIESLPYFNSVNV